MGVIIVTGSSGLIGSETASFFHEKGFDVVGIDNNMRRYFFGAGASVDWNTKRLEKNLSRYTHMDFDIRDEDTLARTFSRYGKSIELIVHCAAQPSHDWAAKEPLTDYSINSTGTANLLEMTRKHCPEATFIFASTNKVYGDTPNRLPLIEEEKRWECSPEHRYSEHGIDETMSVDQTKHSLFGASKLGADILVQEYGRYFGMKTGVFRGGCLTGKAHSGAELLGFLSWLVKCQITGGHYKIFGYKGKQVRDNIHSFDLVNAFWHFFRKPRNGEVYNIGGGRHSNCSIIEASDIICDISGRALEYTLTDDPRIGDHIWWISDVRKFQSHFPDWTYRYAIRDILSEIIEAVTISG